MIGLEYIIKLKNSSKTQLANDLGINKSNVSAWLKGERKIPEKYLTVMYKKYEMPIEYFQGHCDEMLLMKISKQHLHSIVNHIKYMEYNDVIIRDDSEESLITIYENNIELLTILNGIKNYVQADKVNDDNNLYLNSLKYFLQILKSNCNVEKFNQLLVAFLISQNKIDGTFHNEEVLKLAKMLNNTYNLISSNH